MTTTTLAAREYFRAFFDHNRGRFVAALALTVLDIPSASSDLGCSGRS